METARLENVRAQGTQPPDYWQRYLSEREKLFSKSRTISVSEMATTLAHELNQPLGAISNILSGIHIRLADDGDVSTEILDALKMAQEQTQYAANIITRIRDFTQTRKPQFKSMELSDLIRDSIRVFDWAFVAEGVQVSYEEQNKSLFVSGDYVMLQQVVINIFRNAVDAMRSNHNRPRIISISTVDTTDGIKLEVADNGSGFGEDTAANLYTPFHTSKPDGMGVGLNICRSFIELHQGKLWLAPKVDAGCTAHVLLPSSTKPEVDRA